MHSARRDRGARGFGVEIAVAGRSATLTGVPRSPVLVVVVLAVVAAACGDDAPGADADADAASSDTLVVTLVADGFDGPTQIASDADGRIVVAELNGGERDGTGRVVRLDPARPDEREVLVDDLLVPTGVAIDGDLLWIMERRRLTVGPYADPSDRRVVLDELPFNGRSQGTISAVDGGGILYDTSGRTGGGDRLVDGSGTLWFLAGPDAEPERFATGFKHAYAHAPLGDGRWLVTEISDGTFDGEPPPDELVIAAGGDDFGFPRCLGDGEPVEEFGVAAADCADAPGSLAVFEPRATPTSVVVAPWDAATALVALWTLDAIVVVPTSVTGAPHAPVRTGLDVGRAQDLHVVGDAVLVTDHTGGRVLSIRPAVSPSS